MPAWPSREETRFAALPLRRAFSTGPRAALEGHRDEALESMQPFVGSHFRDGEGLFYVAEVFALLDLPEQACAMLTRAVLRRDSGRVRFAGGFAIT